MHVLSADRIELVVGGNDVTEAASIFGVALALGSASLGSSWGAVAVGVAFASSPLTVLVMGGLALYAGWELFC